MSKIIDFYEGHGTDAAGRTFEEVMNKSLHWMEVSHDWVQWIFPLDSISCYNADAPIMEESDFLFFQQEFNHKTNVYDNFMNSIDKFLSFLGIERGFNLACNFDKQKYTWFKFNHNSLRITRFLACVSFWYPDFSKDLLDFMKSIARQNEVKFSENTLNYWSDALKGRNRKFR